jgi:hypothetical protein
MDALPPNVIGFQNKLETSLNGAVLKFEPGHVYIKACLEEFLTNFKNRLWGANGPRLLTRVYFSNPEKWNLKPVNPYYFQYFSYKKIRKDCYEDLRDYKLLQRMNGIRENAYVVHSNNHVGGRIVDGSVCDCLHNTFCLSTKCKKIDHCRPLLEMSEMRRLVTGVDYLDELNTTNLLSLPLDEYAPGKSAPKNASSLKIYVYNRMANHSGKMQASATETVLMNLFETFPGRTYDPDEADLFVVHSSYVETMAAEGSSCSNATTVEIIHASHPASLLEFYNDKPARHVFLLPEFFSDSTKINWFEKSLTLSEISTMPSNQGFSIRVPRFNPHPALQPSAIARRSREWWTKPRKYAFTARDVSVDKFDLSLTSHAFIKHVQGIKSVGNRPFALLEPREVGNTELLSFLQDSTFCPFFFEDDSSVHHLFDAILSGCIPVIPQYENESVLSKFLPFSSRTNYSEFVLQFDASNVSSGSVVQAMKDTVKDKSDLKRRQEKLRAFAMMFSYGLGLDAHVYDDAFQQILRTLDGYLASVSSTSIQLI